MIPVFGNWQVTELCLRALGETEAREVAEVVLVNDASPDDTLNRVREFPWVTVKDLPVNLGYTLACNEGASDADTDYIMFLNNDTEPLPGFLDALIALADADAAIGLVGSRLIYPDGRLQEAGGIIWADASGHNYGRGGSPDDPEYLHVRDVDYCSGASILVRTSLFRDVGGYDAQYSPAYYEDTDLAFAARAMGFRVAYQPMSVVVHQEGATNGTSTSSGIKRYQEVNKPKFLAKWRHELAAQSMPGDTPLRVAARRGKMRGILFIDHAVPTPDRDSGSRRSAEIIAVVRAMGFETMLMTPQDPFNPAAEALRQQGTMVMRGDSELEAFLHAEGDWLDCVFVARVDQAAKWQPWFAARHPSLPIVFDTVDLHHVREARGAQITGSKTAALRARETEERELDLVSRCAVTLVVSDTEREYLQARVPRARVLTVGNIHRSTTSVEPFERRRGLLFVGSFRHAPNADGMEWFLAEVWPLVGPEVREAGIQIVGEEPPATLLRAGHEIGVTIHGWVEDLESLLGTARLSIAPLRYGAGVKGKVGEAWSYGLPVVGTSTAFEGMVDAANPAYLAADAPFELARLIEHVYRTKDAWRAASDAGREYVAQSGSIELAASRLTEVLQKVGVQ